MEMALPRLDEIHRPIYPGHGIQLPEGFVRDYEWTTRVLGMVHYCFWGNRYDCPTLNGFPTLKFSLQCIHQSLYPTSQLSVRVPGGWDTYR